MGLHNHFTMDVEADGPVPGLYNLISIGIVSVGTLADTAPEDFAKPAPSDHRTHMTPWGFYSGVCPMNLYPGIPEARAVSGISFEEQKTFPVWNDAFCDLDAWIRDTCKGDRPIFWSDNPGFDWPWFNYYMTLFYGSIQPHGHSCRRIGDYWAGLQKNPRDTGGWKKFRKTKHDHHALNDAAGMAEGLHHILTKGTKP
jgi:hypothetical protein